MFKITTMKFKSFLLVISLFVANFSTADSSYKVRKTDNLSKIIKVQYKDTQYTDSQLMIAVLAVNPKSFKLGNINALKSRQLLTLPDVSDLQIMDEESAQKLMVLHNKNFKKKSKQQMKSPFQDKNLESAQSTSLNMVQQNKIQKLQELETERAELLARMDKLIQESKQTDLKLQEIDGELEK